MSTGEGSWTVRIAGAAEADFESIVAWTLEQFGDVQARVYSEALSSAMQALIAGPAQPGIKARPEIGRGLFTLHVARNGLLRSLPPARTPNVIPEIVSCREMP